MAVSLFYGFLLDGTLAGVLAWSLLVRVELHITLALVLSALGWFVTHRAGWSLGCGP